jgi:hypothetical protein
MLKTIGATGQFSVGDSHGKFVCEEELKTLFEVCDFSESEYVKTTEDRVKRLSCSECKLCK